MQVLWSRAARTRSSGAGHYMYNATTVTRRTTKAGSNRRLRASDVFTACYTAMFATAAVFDANRKSKRREEWDKAIARARGDTPEQMEEPEDQNLGPNITTQSLEILGRLGVDLLKAGPPDLMHTWIRSKDLQQRLANLHKHLLASAEAEIEDDSPENQQNLEDVPETQFADVTFTPREPLSSIHMSKMEDMVAKLVSCLLSTANVPVKGRTKTSNKRTKEQYQNWTDELRSELIEQINISQTLSTRLPNYSLIDSINSKRESARLDHSITSLLESRGDKSWHDVHLKVAKLCYNLLVSQAPPSVRTYNIMINYFTHIRRHDLAQVVIDSFMNDSRLKPNSRTICQLLEHYTTTKNFAGFRAVVKRMNGEEGDMRIQKRDLSVLPWKEVQRWALTSPVRHRGNALVEKVRRDTNIFDALVVGYLEFSNFTAATMHAKAAFREGCGLSLRVFEKLIRLCIDNHQLKPAKLMLQYLISCKERFWQAAGTLEAPIRELLEFCGIRVEYVTGEVSGLPRYFDQDTFHKVLQQVALGSRLRLEQAGVSLPEESVAELEIQARCVHARICGIQAETINSALRLLASSGVSSSDRLGRQRVTTSLSSSNKLERIMLKMGITVEEKNILAQVEEEPEQADMKFEPMLTDKLARPAVLTAPRKVLIQERDQPSGNMPSGTTWSLPQVSERYAGAQHASATSSLIRGLNPNYGRFDLDRNVGLREAIV